ncbi:MAG: DUF5107 domain-containing protein [Acidipropionibacterium sp.]|jgi:hypothetical protein|nr:DUF5107 domain-containing protein [Acidipropionibacterium sp.]
MDIRQGVLSIPAARTIGENPLPVLRDQLPNTRVLSNGSLLAHEQTRMGENTARRVLPYRMQDRYSRDRHRTDLATIELDNGLLKAVFLPELGGRLYSLTDLMTGQDLLFSNPVFQPANLAIRDAWFSGGIEWNLGHYGHSVTTCDPLFCGIVHAEDGDLMRLWEYERMNGLFWQIDFRMPEGRGVLEAHVRVVNPSDIDVPLYWWTNTAIPQDAGTRVFSGTPEVIYADSAARVAWVQGRGWPLNARSLAKAPNYFGHATLPWFTQSGRAFDASYPGNFDFSSEYFFQTPFTERTPWEAAWQSDGQLFVERSTLPLRFRKMFCWGDHPGGRWWRDYLSEPGRGDYVELQAGLAPTQLHGYTLEAQDELEFTQVFGGSRLDADLANAEWDQANAHVSRVVEDVIPAADLEIADLAAMSRSRIPVSEVLHLGSGWGALEAARHPNQVPEGFAFPADSLSADQAGWMTLLTTGRLPVGTESFMVDTRWRPLLEDTLGTAHGRELATALEHLGLLEWEDFDPVRAVNYWQDAAELGSSRALRNLAVVARSDHDPETAVDLMSQACEGAGPDADRAWFEELLTLLVEVGRYQQAWQTFQGLSEPVRGSERILLAVARAALELGEDRFVARLFERDWAGLREGDTTVIDLWYRREAMRLAARRGVPLTDDLLNEVTAALAPPARIDNRMFRPSPSERPSDAGC